MPRKPLANTHKKLLCEVDGWDPTTISAGSGKKLPWKCLRGHKWVAAVKSRANGSGCPVCSGASVEFGFNDLVTTHPHLAAEAEGWDPTKVSAGSNKKVLWRCRKGHSWDASIGSRSTGTGCPVCSNRRVLPGHNDLATLNPKIAREAFGWDPAIVAPHSNKKKVWLCPLGHQYQATVAHRSEGKGCPFCSGRQVLSGFNDLATTHPDLAAEAHEWNPQTISAGSHKRVNWKCPIGHVSDQVVKNRTLQGFGCSYCSGKRVLKGFNDLATTHPALAREALDWDPTTVSKGSSKKRKWKCSIGHHYVGAIAHRVYMNAGCPFCAGRQVLKGFNDLATTNPDLASEALNWDSTSLSAGSHKKVKWKCSSGHIWTAPPNGRRRGEGCPSCSKSGFNPNKNGWLYLVYHEGWDLLQVGLTNDPESRLNDHRRTGFSEVLDIRGPMKGELAQTLETQMLRALKLRGASFSNTNSEPKFDGYSEAWTRTSLAVTTLKQVLSWVYEDEARK